MNHFLDKIIAHEHLSYDEAKQFIHGINDEQFTSETISGILVGIQMRGIQLEELKGFRKALLELCIPVELDNENAIDLCGTGGDGKNTFNISTTTSFILAAMGKKVIKHGNYGVSSMCGSSNVLEAIGVKFTSDPGELQRQLEENNICFLHAPLFHPTMKKVAPTRKNLGIRTLFNCLGPLVNPAQPRFQLTGTYSLELAKTYQHILKEERSDFRVAYGMDGFDEITLTDNTRILGKQRDFVFNAKELGIPVLEMQSLAAGKTIEDAAKIMFNILNGTGTNAQHQVVAANVANAQQMYNPSVPLVDLFHEALSFIRSGSAFKQLNLN